MTIQECEERKKIYRNILKDVEEYLNDGASEVRNLTVVLLKEEAQAIVYAMRRSIVYEDMNIKTLQGNLPEEEEE